MFITYKSDGDFKMERLKLLSKIGLAFRDLNKFDEEMSGFIGFDECRNIRKWKAEELEILSTVSGQKS